MKFRIFGSKDCDQCGKLAKEMKLVNVPFEFIDADLDETQDLCDECNVDEMPHLQVFSDHDILLMEHIGYISPKRLLNIIKHFNEYK